METTYEKKSLLSDGLSIAVLFEGDNCEEYSRYFPHITLLFVREGKLKVKYGNKEQVYRKGSLFLIKKHTQAWLSAVSAKKGQIHQIIRFTLDDNIINEVLRHVPVPGKSLPIKQRIVSIPRHIILDGFIFSIKKYLDSLNEIDHNLFFIKTMELLLGIMKSNPDLAPVLYDYSRPRRADLPVLMESVCFEKLTLHQIARLSGRSIATFNRDFRKTFDATPHQWILERRLNLARELLLKTNKTSSDIYLEVGFEDLAHFSRSFKRQFGVPPSHFGKERP